MSEKQFCLGTFASIAASRAAGGAREECSCAADAVLEKEFVLAAIERFSSRLKNERDSILFELRAAQWKTTARPRDAIPFSTFFNFARSRHAYARASLQLIR